MVLAPKAIKTFFSFLFCIGVTVNVFATDTKARGFELLGEVIESIDETSGFTYRLKSYERVNGELNYNQLEFKVSLSPLRVYMNCLEKPHKGVQIIYDASASHGQARVNPGLFIPVVKLDPMGNKMRKDGHHAIYDAGFGLIRDILAKTLESTKTSSQDEKPVISYHGAIDFNEVACEKVSIDYPGFRFVSYEVKKGESLYSIAKARHISEFLIRQANPELSEWEDQVEAGAEILIPTFYSQKSILYIDSETKMPIYQEMYDDKGMFEKYLFLDLKVNPDLGAEDFSF